MRLGISTLVLDHHLTRKGARLLDDQGCDVRRSLLDGIDKERGAGWRFVEHTVSIAGFFVELEIAIRARTDLRLLNRTEILEDAPSSKRERQVRIQATIRLDGILRRNAVIPDAVFCLRFNDEEESYLMLEIDRGEMPVERYNNLHRTYFAKKLLTYYEATREQWYIQDLGIRRSRARESMCGVNVFAVDVGCDLPPASVQRARLSVNDFQVE